MDRVQSVGYKRKGDLKKRGKFWGRSEMGMIGLALQTAIKKRAFMQGHGVNDSPHKAYSTNPIYISRSGKTAKRLKPKGGRKTKRSVFYAGGYREYKRASTTGSKGPGSGKPNLTLSGQLLRSIRLGRVTRTRAIVRMWGRPKVYGSYVDSKRPFFGISRNDSKVIGALFRDILKAHAGGRGRLGKMAAGRSLRVV